MFSWLYFQGTPRLSEDKVKQCVDPKLKGKYPPKTVAKLAAVAALRVQYEAEFRPSMRIVVNALQPLSRSSGTATAPYREASLSYLWFLHFGFSHGFKSF
ncbi:hypothetical protein N665_0373s0017 [Sinapis alba]|nr:hypothetical protein N665_0373s0017 [Sinapis alba]